MPWEEVLGTACGGSGSSMDASWPSPPEGKRIKMHYNNGNVNSIKKYLLDNYIYGIVCKKSNFVIDTPM